MLDGMRPFFELDQHITHDGDEVERHGAVLHRERVGVQQPVALEDLGARMGQDGGGDEGLLAGVRRQDLVHLFDAVAQGALQHVHQGLQSGGRLSAPDDSSAISPWS